GPRTGSERGSRTPGRNVRGADRGVAQAFRTQRCLPWWFVLLVPDAVHAACQLANGSARTDPRPAPSEMRHEMSAERVVKRYSSGRPGEPPGPAAVAAANADPSADEIRSSRLTRPRRHAASSSGGREGAGESVPGEGGALDARGKQPCPLEGDQIAEPAPIGLAVREQLPQLGIDRARLIDGAVRDHRGQQ